MSASPIVIASEPVHVYRALLNPGDILDWWGCSLVTDARVGGVWVGGWGEGANGLGQATVLPAQISQLEPDKLVALKIGGVEIAFHIAADPLGAAVSVEQPGADTPDLDSWVAAIGSLKAWLEKNHPYTAPPQPETAPAASPTPAQPPGAVQGEHGADPYAVAGADTVTVLDEGGFGVTDPHAVVKSWSKEQGFGYATHAELGDVVFDYDGCDFEPTPGDEVLLLVIGKRYDGQPKIKRIACPAKGSNIR